MIGYFGFGNCTVVVFGCYLWMDPVKSVSFFKLTEWKILFIKF